MEIRRGTLATSTPDLDGDVFSLEALEDMCRQINERYLPIIDEHDPRSPPLGRIHRAWTERRPDGVTTVEAELHFFDPDDSPEVLAGDGRHIVVHEHEGATLALHYDRTFGNPFAPDPDVAELAEQLGARLEFQAKKSMEPLGVILLTLGTLAAGNVASGFFSAVGQDVWNALKSGVKSLFRAREERAAGALLVVEVTVSSANGRTLVARCIVEDAGNVDIDRAVRAMLAQVDRIVPQIIGEPDRVVMMTLAHRDGRVECLYLVRRDGIPLSLERVPPNRSES